MKRAVVLTLALLSTAVLQSSCATVNRCPGCRKFEVPATKPVGDFKLTIDKPSFLYIRFLNEVPKKQSYVVLVLVDAEGTRILDVVGPLIEDSNYIDFFKELSRGSALLCPAGYFCLKGDCRIPSPPMKPRESPGPPPPSIGSITTSDVFSGSIVNDANAAANAAIETVQAANH